MGTEDKSKNGELKKGEELKTENLLDNERLRKLVSEELDFETLSPEEKTEFHNRFIEGDEEGVPTIEEEAATKLAAENSQGEGAQNQIQAQKTTVTNANEVKPKGEESADAQELKRKLKAEKDANNTLKQRLDNASAKLESINAMKVPEPPKIEDALDDNLTKQDKWNRELANKLNTYANTEAQSIQKDKVVATEKLLYSDISILQSENPELRSSLPIETIDKTYVRFRDGLAGVGATEIQKNEAVDKYFTDTEFRKSKEGEGHVFAINDSDWSSYKTVTQLIGYKRNGGNPGYDSANNGDKYQELDVAYYKYKKDNGIIPDPVKQAVLEATTKVVEQVAGNQNKPNLLSPEYGKSSEGIDGMTEQQAEAWLIDHPIPSTPEDIAILKGILNKFSPSSAPQTREVVF